MIKLIKALNCGVLQECQKQALKIHLKVLLIKFQFVTLKFKGIYLKSGSVSFIHKTVVDLCNSYKLDTWSKYLNTDSTKAN